MTSHNDLVVIVVGSRKWERMDRVHLILDSYLPRVVVETNGPGAAHHARLWVAQRGLITRSYTAHWSYYGRDAARRRDCQMLQEWRRHHNVRVCAFPLLGDTEVYFCMEEAMSLGINVENYG